MEIKTIRILLIEDNPDDVAFLRMILRRAAGPHYDLQCAGSLAEGLTRLAEGGIDVILLDLTLPDSSGMETFQRLKARDRDVPIIVLSGLDDETLAVNAVHAGAEDYLVKGRVDSQLITRAIIYAIERTETKRAALKAEERYRGIFENSITGIFQTTPEGSYMDVNPALIRMYGDSSREEMIARISDIGRVLYVDPNRRAEFVRLMHEHGVVQDFESQIYRKDGSIIWIAESARAVRDGNGKILYYEGMVEDITVRKQAEERERQANAELARSQSELRKKNEILEDDLKMARDIQQAILPQQYPTFPPGALEESSLLHFCHRYHPTGQVGGDFFNVLALSDTTAGLFICDVMGHGVRSALVTAMVRGLVEELRPSAMEPGQLLTRINSDLRAILQQTGTPLFTTAFYLVADLESRQILYANAGHPKPFLIHRPKGTVEVLKYADGKARPALGLFSESVYPTACCDLSAGDLVMLFTDGLYEVEGEGGLQFSPDLLFEAVSRHATLHGPELFSALLAEIQQFSASHEFSDDVCLVGMEVSEHF